jgi:hypothetical protein
MVLGANTNEGFQFRSGYLCAWCMPRTHNQSREEHRMPKDVYFAAYKTAVAEGVANQPARRCTCCRASKAEYQPEA